MPFTTPSDSHARKAQSNGTQKSMIAQARFCTEPVTLPVAPWEKEEAKEEKE